MQSRIDAPNPQATTRTCTYVTGSGIDTPAHACHGNGVEEWISNSGDDSLQCAIVAHRGRLHGEVIGSLSSEELKGEMLKCLEQRGIDNSTKTRGRILTNFVWFVYLTDEERAPSQAERRG